METLLEPRPPSTDLLDELAQYPWDSDQELVELTRDHVAAVLRRYLLDEMSSPEVEAWANAIETREDVAMARPLADILFKLANPVLEGPLTSPRAREFLDRLS